MECPSKHAFYFPKCHTQRGGKYMFDKVPFITLKESKQVFMKNPPIF
jgi:hypothetical protein